MICIKSDLERIKKDTIRIRKKENYEVKLKLWK